VPPPGRLRHKPGRLQRRARSAAYAACAERIREDDLKRLLALLAAASVAPATALADDMTFFMKNDSGGGIAIEFRSRDRDYRWPGGDQVYFLDTGERKSVGITCNAGENICFAAWVNGNDGISWGVGPDGDRDCTDCCRICTAGATETIDVAK
jgi:hypothetical protein